MEHSTLFLVHLSTTGLGIVFPMLDCAFIPRQCHKDRLTEEYKSTVTHAGELTVQERTARHSLKEPRVRVADTQATVRSLFSPNFLRDGSACSLPFGWGPGLPFGKARLLPFEDV